VRGWKIKTIEAAQREGRRGLWGGGGGCGWRKGSPGSYEEKDLAVVFETVGRGSLGTREGLAAEGK